MYTSWMRYAAFLVCLCAITAASEGEKDKKKLQIGVKKRVDPEKCKIKSKKGDTLHMHYAVR